MATAGCVLVTKRLIVRNCIGALGCAEDGFAQSVTGKGGMPRVLSGMLVENVTKSLPPDWQGDYSEERAMQWMQEREKEGTTVLLCVEKEAKEPIGLMILFEMDYQGGGKEVRLGYLLREQSWGKGFASELIGAFVPWCRSVPSIRSIAGGVAKDNPASARVLEKNGFHVSSEESTEHETMFRLEV
uniref:N-acetyltransferase domain-containing protein n=1 Tax=Mucochytrium quahogii TaxID=96639 RepID=A0A7S2SE02_9STRA|mmetsp:Transcript_8156/g.13161  ORF Transcript_8156/g.13161 Transcript_8156/m.13161 type:complete len:186 (+) Transcript_8156:114-671(+)|eukprot:CAMPEP_0203757236 /NCGR_PEP_ID=MMETSP0098-20131031/10363_1 /ASSEMBLY_ACC=CAM_ASM_000208 /TAXON_ID=96639 /ORGANISM=" , Strain NY0313808BC1" /LENGTH=185 /DNA_ID=CAMNT_0050649401 /DNA_START=54 /DNA_END=611 /DNA_ORIENTATION=+